MPEYSKRIDHVDVLPAVVRFATVVSSEEENASDAGIGTRKKAKPGHGAKRQKKHHPDAGHIGPASRKRPPVRPGQGRMVDPGDWDSRPTQRR